MLKNKFLSFVLFALVTYSASVIGSLTVIGYKEPWYSTLAKPSFNPPDYIFPTVWVILYMSMAFAAWLIWINPKKQEKIIYVYFIHLLVNASWSVVFFALHQIFLALLVIVVIILLVVWLIKQYYPINKLSAALMVPYLIWLGFAFALNLNILLYN